MRLEHADHAVAVFPRCFRRGSASKNGTVASCPVRSLLQFRAPLPESGNGPVESPSRTERHRPFPTVVANVSMSNAALPLLLPTRRLAENVLEELWFGDDDPRRTDLEASSSLAAAVGAASGLKSFPAVAQQIMSLLAEPDVDLSKVQDVMERDPALASQLLRVANSPVFRPVRPYASLEQAILRLGTRQVGELVAGVATMGMFKDVDGIGLRIRDHCAGVAAIARVIAMELRYRGVGSVFLAGLLHDVGKLLSLQVGEVGYDEFDETLLETADVVHLVEREFVGYDHAVLGAHLLERWQMSELVMRAVAWHHQPGRAYEQGGDVAKVVAMLRIADRIEYQVRTGQAPDEEFTESLARDAANAYIDYSSDVYQAMWPKFEEAYRELLSALV